MKPIIIILALLLCTLTVNSQPTTGWKIGTNYTFYKDSKDVDYSPKMGYQLGYSWGIKLNETLALSVEGMFTKKTAEVDAVSGFGDTKINEQQNAYYISAPLAINYNLKSAYIGAGYEFGVNTTTGSLPVNDYDHALFLQTAYKIKYFDVVLKYATSLNKEPGGTFLYGNSSESSTTQSYTARAKTLQLSFIFNFSSKAN